MKRRRITGRNLIKLFTGAYYKDIDKVSIYINSKFVFAFNPTICKVINIDQMLDDLDLPMYVDHTLFISSQFDVFMYTDEDNDVDCSNEISIQDIVGIFKDSNPSIKGFIPIGEKKYKRANPDEFANSEVDFVTISREQISVSFMDYVLIDN